ncbi:type 3 dihydrofolate reductase [Nitrosococcus wardiae]|uniref:Dihydrofolate reductase n=1 Tax=Nitrosococcus wardiae TaxID=1814290 RepID=A0A4P7BV38_9GAMM|nr:type 3 dihydrofolate reductase [Nitrosococcus wardiae]QBQ53858.1 type 3 dihydrofolate reductase [Nitrosococcus wardiae]
MIISFVVAMDDHRLIGANCRLPWHLSADLKYFRRLTMGKPILMGRGTHESIGRPLPGRHNIVVTHNPHYEAPGCTVVPTVEAGLQAAGEAEEVMVIGGAALYQQLLPQAHRIYLTLIWGTFRGDTWFPDFDPADWTEVWREDHGPDSQNPYPYSFIRLERAIGKKQGGTGPPC